MPQQKPKNDYDELSREIERDVRQAVEAVGAALRGVASGAQSAFGKDAAGDVAGALGGAARRAGQAFGSAAGAAAQGFRAAAQPARRAAEKKRRLKKLRGRRESAAIAAGGHLAMGALFTALAVTTAIEDGWAGVPVLAVFAVWGFVSGVFKVRKARRLRLLVGYMTVLEDRSYCRVSELAAATSRTERAVLADVRRFLQMGEMEGMYLSPDGARLFTGRTAYLSYLAQQEAAGRAQQPEEPAAEAAAPTVSEVYESFLQELGAEKARIRDKEVCAKVEKLERHTRQIAAWLKQHPDKEASVRRFSGYYLPTVLKLLRTYNEVEQHAGDSSVASGIQQEIGDILETIDKAFVTLHDGLLEDTALNVSAEISALETVLAQDGLVQDGMAGQ